jgi:hypothetical protein
MKVSQFSHAKVANKLDHLLVIRDSLKTPFPNADKLRMPNTMQATLLREEREEEEEKNEFLSSLKK